MNPLVAANLPRQHASLRLRAWVFATAAILLGMVGSAFASADNSVTLAWNANTETNIAGYRLRYGVASGAYTGTVEAGTNLTATATGLADGTTYYFAVVAYNTTGQTSPNSSEVAYTTPGIPNTAPVASAQSLVTDEDTNVTATLSATDGEGDALVYTLVSAPAKGSLTGTAPDLTYRPATNATGADSFSFKVSDGMLESATVTVLITIIPVNDAPVANSTSIATTKGTNVAATLSASDPEGTPLTYMLLSAPAKGTLTGTAPNLTYRPTSDATGDDSFSFKVSDGTLESGAATVSITINPANDPPSANPQSLVTAEDTSLGILLTGTDPESGNLTYATVAAPANGTLSGTPPNLTYTPKLNFSGADSFTFRVNDGTSNSANATVSVSVTPVNDAPVAQPVSISATTGSSSPATLVGSDVDGNPLTYTVVSQPAKGSLGGTAPNLTYTPNQGASGSDSFTYRVNDGTVNSAVATASITINQGNTAPAAQAKAVSTAEDNSLPIVLSGSDPQNNPLTYSVVTTPSNGTLAGTPPNLTYTPRLNFNGTDSFTFRVNDGALNSANATVTINVSAVNDAPVAAAGGYSTNRNTPVSITLAGSDVESGGLTFAVSANPANGTLSGTLPNLTYTPNNNFAGSDQFTYWVNDGTANSALATVTINVANTGGNRAPLANPLAVAVLANKSVRINLGGSDADLNLLNYRVMTTPANGTLTGTPPNLTYTPNRGYKGPDRFTYVANDGILDSPVATVTVNVKGKNSKPLAKPSATTVNMNAWGQTVLSATDADGDVLTYTLVAGPKNGKLTGTPPYLNYAPNWGFKGKDTFTYRASDGAANSAVATFTINVVKVSNSAPTVASKWLTTAAGKPIIITLSSYDSDGEAATYRVLTRPSSGSLAGKGGKLTYKPAKGFIGIVSFIFVANDGTVDSAPATITINVVNAASIARALAVDGGKTAGAADPLPTLIMQANPARAGGLLLQASGRPGASYVLESSPDLSNWEQKQTIVIGEEGVATVDLTIPQDSKKGFYRLSEP